MRASVPATSFERLACTFRRFNPRVRTFSLAVPFLLQGHPHKDETEIQDMTQTNIPPRENKRLVARRLTLVGSAAALSSAILLAGVPAVPLPVSGGAAHAAALASQPAGFADLVAKVKPAVISVRVKLDEQITGMNGQASPTGPGAPPEKFFRQFGLPGQRPGGGHRVITGEGSRIPRLPGRIRRDELPRRGSLDLGAGHD